LEQEGQVSTLDSTRNEILFGRETLLSGLDTLDPPHLCRTLGGSLMRVYPAGTLEIINANCYS